MKSAVHNIVTTLKRNMAAFRKADESLFCSDKTCQKQVQLLSPLSTNKCTDPFLFISQGG
jgi:hypothetical protein